MRIALFGYLVILVINTARAQDSLAIERPSLICQHGFRFVNILQCLLFCICASCLFICLIRRTKNNSMRNCIMVAIGTICSIRTFFIIASQSKNLKFSRFKNETRTCLVLVVLLNTVRNCKDLC